MRNTVLCGRPAELSVQVASAWWFSAADRSQPRAELDAAGQPDSTFSDFRIYQYRDADGRAPLAVQEYG